MIRNARQERILRRLALLGDGPAAFYRDACRIIGDEPRLETAAHLLAHALREIESALRRVLLPVDYQPPPQCDACGNRSEGHKAQVQAILRAYNFASTDVVFVAWLRLCDSDDLGLHRLAHRDSLGSPREIDSTIEELWDLMESFLDALLDKFESRFADHLPFIDELLRKEHPGKRDVSQLLTRIPYNDVTAEYFFTRASAKWLEPLRKADVLKNPASGERSDDGSTRFPVWHPSKYLARLAQQEQDDATRREVGVAALDLVNTDNPWVQIDLAAVYQHAPIDLAVRFVPAANGWLSARCGLRLPELLGQLSVRLLEAGARPAALELLRALLETTLASAPGSLGEAEVDVRYDAFEFEQFVQKILPRAAALGGLDVLRVLCAALGKAVGLMLSVPDARDDGCSFRAAIEDHRQNMPNTQRVLSGLIEAVRDVADRIANDDPTQLANIIGELEAHKGLIFRRLALYVLHRHPAADHAALARYLLAPGDIDSVELWHERRLLERHGFPHLTLEEQDRLLAQISAGPDISTIRYPGLSGEPASEAEIERRAKRWRVHHLSTLAHALAGSRRAEYDHLVAEIGEPSHADFLTYVGEVWTGPTSPRTDVELAGMTVPQLVEYLSAWQPSGEFMTPSREGMGRTLKKVVARDPARFVEQSDLFLALHPTYVRAVIEGLGEAVTASRPFTWEGALKLFTWVTSQPPGEERSSDEAIDRDEDQGWSWTRKAIAELLRAGLVDGPGAIPAELADNTWKVISNLVERPDANDHGWGSPFDQALNTLHGAAIHAALEYALWRTRRLRGHSDAAPGGFGDMPEVASLLERHLDPVRDPSRATRALFGVYLPGLVAVDRQWVSDRLRCFFPEDPSLHDARDATWGAYVERTQPFPRMLDLVRAQFERSFLSLHVDAKPANRDRWIEGIVRHIAGLYWLGQLPLQEGLLDDFYRHADEASRAALVKQIGFSFFHAEQVDPPIVERVQVLWLHRRSVAGAMGTEARQVELSPFGWWFASSKFEDGWALEQLRSLLELGVYPELDHAVTEKLGQMAESRPVPVLECLDRLLARDADQQWRVIRCRRGITAALTSTLANPDPSVSQAARELCNRLVARGHREFIALLPLAPAPEPKPPTPRKPMGERKKPGRPARNPEARQPAQRRQRAAAREAEHSSKRGVLSAVIQLVLGFVRRLRRGHE